VEHPGFPPPTFLSLFCATSLVQVECFAIPASFSAIFLFDFPVFVLWHPPKAPGRTGCPFLTFTPPLCGSFPHETSFSHWRSHGYRLFFHGPHPPLRPPPPWCTVVSVPFCPPSFPHFFLCRFCFAVGPPFLGLTTNSHQGLPLIFFPPLFPRFVVSVPLPLFPCPAVPGELSLNRRLSTGTPFLRAFFPLCHFILADSFFPRPFLY